MLIFSIILIIFFAFTVWSSFAIDSQIFLRVKCKSKNLMKGLLLTFDDGPDPLNTQKIIDILEKHGVKALFFVTGLKAEINTELIKIISEKGHTVGNHSYTHSNFFPFYLKNRIITDLKKTSEIIERITGQKVIYFRPPFGVTNPGIASAVNFLKYKTIGWSVRSLDTFYKEKEKIISSVTKKIKGGDIILFHDTVGGTVEMLDEFIVKCKSDGFEFTDPEKFLAGE